MRDRKREGEKGRKNVIEKGRMRRGKKEGMGEKMGVGEEEVRGLQLF